MTKFEDIMFDTDPLELAEELSELENPVKITICSDEEADSDDDIYFGLPSEIGEIIEVKATVEKSSKTGEDEYEIDVSVTHVDSELKKVAIDTMTGKIQKSSEGEPVWARGLKQQDGSYAILANSPGGLLNSKQLRAITEIAENGAGKVKLTHAQRMVILIKADQIEAAAARLEETGLQIGVMHHGIRNVRACSGTLCRFCQQTNSLPLAQEVSQRFFGRGTAFDIKIAISDCMRNCSESYCADIGLIGDKDTYTVIVGGRGSQVPFRALRLTSGVKPNEATDLIEKIVDWYTSHAKHGERLHKLLHRLGSEQKLDLTELQDTFEANSDGIDELPRISDQFTRLKGLAQLKEALAI